MNRPLVWIAVPFLGGLLTAAEISAPFPLISALLGLAGVVVLVASGPSDLLVRLGCVLIFGSAGALYWEARDTGAIDDALLDRALERPDALMEIEGIVERPDVILPGSGYGQFILRAVRCRATGEAEWTPVEAGVHVRWYAPSFPVFPGDRMRVSGRLEHALSSMNPGVSSYEDYLRARDVHTALRLVGAGEIERIESGPAWAPSYLAARFRLAQAERLRRVVPEAAVPFVLTVWLGERRLIDNETYRRFVESGTAHVLAVSGVHTGIVYLTASFLLGLVLRNYRYRRVRGAVVMAVVLLFALTAGARVSSLRAAVMIGLYIVAEFVDREPDAPTALSIAALLFTLHDPRVMFDLGFVLSFLSIASILIFREPLSELAGAWPRALREGFATPLAVQILPLPAAAAFFNIVPLLGTLANLVVVPLLSIVLWLTLLTSIASFVYEPVASIFGHALYPVVWLINGIAEWVSSLSVSNVEAVRPTRYALIAWAFLAWAFYRLLTARTRRTWWAVATAGALVAVAFLWNARSDRSEIVFLDVGQGDATVVRTRAGGVMVVDAGDRIGSVDYGRRVVAPYLRAHGVSRIAALVGTHPDNDHLGGLAYLLRHFEVETLYLTHADTESPVEARLEDICAERGIPLRRIARGDELPLPGAAVEVLNPPREWGATVSDNDRSVVLRVTLEGQQVLLTGDIERLAERAVAEHDCSAGILKVPHHASRTSSSAAFVDAVGPAYATVSTGRKGRKRILSPSVLQSYRDRGILLLRTDYSGGIRFRFDEGEMLMETARGLKGYPHPGAGDP